MEIVHLKAPAKVNLTLDVLSKRSDGYHDLVTIMHDIPLFDLITLRIGTGAGYVVQSNLPYIKPETNVALKAAKAFFDMVGIENPGVRIDIKKVIPVGAGLGGGSADAAAILRALNHWSPVSLEKSALYKLGASLGADVPFCLHGRCALAEGIGDRLTPLPTLPPCHMLVVKPPFPISTGALFSALDLNSIGVRPNTDAAIAALKSGNLQVIAEELQNALSASASKLHPEIERLKTELLGAGALGAVMSGSGSALFALFEDEGKVRRAEALLRTGRRQVFRLRIGA